jgi:hypothetical protein
MDFLRNIFINLLSDAIWAIAALLIGYILSLLKKFSSGRFKYRRSAYILAAL